MPIIFLESYYKIYSAPLFSLSTIICLILLAFVIILPFFASFAADEFWTKYSSYYEQPTIDFSNQFILNVLQNDEAYYYSSVIKLNEYYENVLPIPLVKTESIDSNNDDKIDKYKLKISFPSEPQNIKNIKLMIFYNYSLNDKIKLSMHTMSIIDIDTPNGAAFIYTNGNINLNLKSPISSSTIAKSLYYTDIFVNMTSPLDYTYLYKEYISRNLTTPYVYDKIIMPFRSNKETVIEIEMTVPSYQNVVYISPILLVLKLAWIQYLSLLIPCAIIIYLISLFIFKYQIFDTAVINNLPYKNK